MTAAATAWEARPLGQVADVDTPEPTIGDGCIVYPGARHIFMGEPESGKTICAYATALEELRSDPAGWVALVDFEMSPELARSRFREMGATDDELDRILCFTPDTAPKPGEVARVLLSRADTPEPNPRLVIYDSWAGASALLGLDDGKRADIETFARVYVSPLWTQGVTTIVLDHVTKSREGRGRWAIGSERKLGVVDVALGFEVVKQMSRGHDGIVKLTTAKDRFGYLPRPTAAMLELHSAPDTYAITWTWKPPATTDAGDTFQPTILMQRVSEYLENAGEPVSRKLIEENVKGKSRDWIRKAIDQLIAGGHATEHRGPHNARMVTLEKPYRASSPSSPDLAQTSPGEDGSHLAQFAPLLQRGELPGEDDDETARLLERHGGIV